MHQVLIVDDEVAVTTSLQHEIEWEELGLTVAAIAKNGIEALEIIENHPIEILITDIRMANLDGLSLARHVSRSNQKIQIIMISSYAEFSYAQKALSYGAIGYCLKPLEYGELTRHLQHAVRRLEKLAGDFHYDDLLDSIYNAEKEEILQNLRKLGFSGSRYHTAVSISRKALPVDNHKIIVLHLGHKHYCYLSAVPFVLPKLEPHFTRVDLKGFSYTRMPVPLEELAGAIRRLDDRAFRFFFVSGQTIFPDAPDTETNSYASEFARVVAGNDSSQLLSLLENLDQDAADAMSLRSAWQLFDIIASSDNYSFLVEADDIFTREQMVFQYGTFQNMLDILCQRLKRSSFPPPLSESMSNSAFLRMVRYIDAHLTQGCSLQQLASEMNMSANYLGQIFKREAGKTYTAYITEMRIERAKEMLDGGDLSIDEIAASLGFNDYFYFLKTFKRVTGLTPKQYRQRAL